MNVCNSDNSAGKPEEIKKKSKPLTKQTPAAFICHEVEHLHWVSPSLKVKRSPLVIHQVFRGSPHSKFFISFSIISWRATVTIQFPNFHSHLLHHCTVQSWGQGWPLSGKVSFALRMKLHRNWNYGFQVFCLTAGWGLSSLAWLLLTPPQPPPPLLQMVQPWKSSFFLKFLIPRVDCCNQW